VISIEWVATPPPDEIFVAPGIRASEVTANITQSLLSLFPPQPVSTDQSKIKSLHIPNDKPEWLIVSFPWRTPEEEEPLTFSV
jgi:hypothetical protein